MGTFVFTIAMITMVAIAIDFFEKIDRFLKDTVPMKGVIFDYYLNFIPWINGLLWPLFVLISVIFFTSRMASNSEIIAMLSAGISFRRILRPFLISAILLATLLWIGRNLLIPHCTKIKNEFYSEYIKKNARQTLENDTHFYLNPDEKIYIRYFRKSDSSAQNFKLEKFKQGELEYLLKARRLKYIEHPNKWQLQDYEYLKLKGKKQEFFISHGENMDTTLNLTPSDFFRYTRQMEMLSTPELKQFISLEQSRGLNTAKQYKTELYSRVADPVTLIILTLIGMTIASRKVRGGMGLHLALGVIIGSAYVILSKFSQTFAINMGMPALLGAWIPNIIFLILSLYLLHRAQK